MLGRIKNYKDGFGDYVRGPRLNIDVVHHDRYELVIVARHFVKDKKISFSYFVASRTRPSIDLILDGTGLLEADSVLPAELIELRRKHNLAHFAVCGLQEGVRGIIEVVDVNCNLWNKLKVDFFNSVNDALREYGHLAYQ